MRLRRGLLRFRRIRCLADFSASRPHSVLVATPSNIKTLHSAAYCVQGAWRARKHRALLQAIRDARWLEMVREVENEEAAAAQLVQRRWREKKSLAFVRTEHVPSSASATVKRGESDAFDDALPVRPIWAVGVCQARWRGYRQVRLVWRADKIFALARAILLFWLL